MADPTAGLAFEQIPIPYQNMFYEDYVLGINNLSLNNRLDPNGDPLVALGNVFFEPSNAVLRNLNAGLASAVPRNLYDHTTFTVFQPTYNIPQDGVYPPTLPKPGFSISSDIVSWNNSGQFCRFVGSSFTYRTPGLNDITTQNSNGAGNTNGYDFFLPYATYYPDGSIVQADRWVILVTSSNATEAYFSLENEVSMQTHGPLPHNVLNTPNAATKLFGSLFDGDTARLARYMVSKYMTKAQVDDVVLYLRRSMRKRGIVC